MFNIIYIYILIYIYRYIVIYIYICIIYIKLHKSYYLGFYYITLILNYSWLCNILILYYFVILEYIGYYINYTTLYIILFYMLYMYIYYISDDHVHSLVSSDPVLAVSVKIWGAKQPHWKGARFIAPRWNADTVVVLIVNNMKGDINLNIK